MRSVEITLVKELDRLLKGPQARRVLYGYSVSSPPTLLLVIACLQLTEETQTDSRRANAAEALRRAVLADCGLYQLCREWCELHRGSENAVTVALRQRLLDDLFRALPVHCQRMVQNQPPMQRRVEHRCLWASPLPGAPDPPSQQKPPPC